MDTGGRYFYIREEAVVVTLGTREEKADRYECRHGLGIPAYMEREAALCRGIDFVPDLNGEVHKVSIHRGQPGD